jgi:hypothetical protein
MGQQDCRRPRNHASSRLPFSSVPLVFDRPLTTLAVVNEHFSIVDGSHYFPILAMSSAVAAHAERCSAPIA